MIAKEEVRDSVFKVLTYMVFNLSGVDLSGADLRYADLSGANLNGADLSDADLRIALHAFLFQEVVIISLN